MNEIEVSVLVVKATYKVNHLYGMLRNICLHDAKQLIAMIQLIAIAFQRIFPANPTILLSLTHKQSTAENKTRIILRFFFFKFTYLFHIKKIVVKVFM